MCEFCQLYYDSIRNIMTDDMGYIVYNIFDYMTPNDLFMLRKNKKDMLIEHNRYGQFVEVIYED